jgi:hypothetical protein
VSAVTLKAGDLVYRVAAYDPAEEGAIHTWKIEHRVVKQASDRQIVLKSFFPGHFRIQFDPTALGLTFFATPQLAVEAFAEKQRAEIENLDRKRKAAERALAWAYESGAAK